MDREKIILPHVIMKNILFILVLMSIQKSAQNIKIKSVRSSENEYSGLDAYKLAKLLLASPDISENDLATQFWVDAGHHNSGIGDLKRFVRAILDLGITAKKDF